MDSPLRVLILEDNPNDAELALLELRRAGYTVDWRRVDNENDFLAALATPIDIILADYQLPQFDGMRALRLLRDRGLDAPFILLSGTVGEDIAVEAVKLSADDYLLKDRLARLGPAVTNALQAKAMRDEQRRMQQILQRRLSFEQLAVAISTRLLSAGAGQVDAAVQATLQNIGEFSDAAYCFLHLFGADGITVERGYEWHIDGAQPLTEKLLGNSLLQLRRRFRNIRSHAAANVYRLANSPLRTDGMFDPLQFQNARYLLWVPLVLREAMLGYFGLAASHEFSSWDDEDMALLRILGESYANVITRAQAEERLAGERNLFRTVIDNLPDAIYAKDRAGRFILVNPGVSHLLGTAPEDILGKTDLQFFSTEEALQYMADDQSVMTAGGTIREQAEVVRDHAGRPFWYASTKVPLRDGQDNIIGMVGIGRDITERKRAEEELRKREQQLSSIYDTVADVIFHLAVEKDGRYRFISVNQAFLSTAGLDYDQVVGKQVNEVIPEPSLTMVLGKYAEAIREKRIVRWEETSEYPTGRLTGEVSVAPVFDDAGNCIHLVGAVHDITERKRAEEALRHSRDLLDLTGQMAKVGGWELDLKTQTLSWTEEVYRIHEVDPATRLDVAEAINFYAPEARPVIAAAVQAGIDSATPWDLELPLITAQERRVWVRAQGAAERKDGRTVRLYGAFQDITERKRAEDAVRES
ncbi:MAG: PAS domain S-box protein, partial [Chloroflexi bacterium]|nr:PAS domain S-box protein [Chloroflexota bacterium]